MAANTLTNANKLYFLAPSDSSPELRHRQMDPISQDYQCAGHEMCGLPSCAEDSRALPKTRAADVINNRCDIVIDSSCSCLKVTRRAYYDRYTYTYRLELQMLRYCACVCEAGCACVTESYQEIYDYTTIATSPAPPRAAEREIWLKPDTVRRRWFPVEPLELRSDDNLRRDDGEICC
ncbi:hypothetical protein CBL_12866 [Carabus blaptoides fortunei]